MTPQPATALLTLRAALIFSVALVIGVLAGTLSYLDEGSVAGAVLLGAGAAGGSLVLLNNVIGR